MCRSMGTETSFWGCNPNIRTRFNLETCSAVDHDQCFFKVWPNQISPQNRSQANAGRCFSSFWMTMSINGSDCTRFVGARRSKLCESFFNRWGNSLGQNQGWNDVQFFPAFKAFWHITTDWSHQHCTFFRWLYQIFKICHWLHCSHFCLQLPRVEFCMLHPVNYLCHYICCFWKCQWILNSIKKTNSDYSITCCQHI